MKQPDGLRSWLEQADELGEIRTIEGADWDLEIGGVADIVNERGSSPAVLFDSVTGYPKGYRVLVNSLGSTRRLGLSLGMPQNLSAMEFVSEWRRRSKDLKHISPRVVRDGPVLENIQRGKDVNILSFPTPRWFELDGGRYIGTGSVNITHDPEEGWTNLGTARVMIHDENTVGFYIAPRASRAHPSRQGVRARRTVQSGDLGRARSVDFSCRRARSSLWRLRVRLHRRHSRRAGRCHTRGVHRLADSGDGGDRPGRRVCARARRDRRTVRRVDRLLRQSARPEPIVKIQPVMYRNHPILLGLHAQVARAAQGGAGVGRFGRRRGAGRARCVVSRGGRRGVFVFRRVHRATLPRPCRQAGLVATECHAGAYLGRYTVVVDDDIDPTNLERSDVGGVHAVGSGDGHRRSCAAARSGPLDPIIPKDQKRLQLAGDHRRDAPL